jgi:hypothetical protein
MELNATRIASSLFALAALTASAGTLAQTAINTTTALAGTDYGYFQDQPGFPVQIFAPGSYKLTSNLVVPAGVSGVEIYSSGVTLDLNGFEIRSNSICTRNDAISTVYCPNPLGKVGVELKTGGNTVRNGRISGFETAIQTHSNNGGGGDLFEALLLENGRTGMSAYAGASKSIVRNVRAQKLVDNGFAGSGLLIQGSVASNTGGYGFLLSSSMVTDSLAVNNKIKGFYGGVGLGLAVGRNTAWGNLGGDFHDVDTMGDNLNSQHVRF